MGQKSDRPSYLFEHHLSIGDLKGFDNALTQIKYSLVNEEENAEEGSSPDTRRICWLAKRFYQPSRSYLRFPQKTQVWHMHKECSTHMPMVLYGVVVTFGEPNCIPQEIRRRCEVLGDLDSEALGLSGSDNGVR